MNVLFLTEEPISFSETMVRGGQIHVRNVVEGLRDKGHDVHLLDWNAEPERDYQHSLSPQSRFIVDPVRTYRRAVSVGRDSNADVVVSKTRKTYLPGLAAARRLGVPHVVHVGSVPASTNDGILGRIEDASIAGRLRAPHDGYFVVCDAIADDLEKLGISRDQVFDVRNAVDTERFHPDRIPKQLDETYRRQIDEFDDDAFILGFVGGLQSYKGLDDLADALDETGAECRVVIAGDGPESERLRRKFGSKAAFLGAVPNEQIPEIYHRIDSFVLPSHTEGLPRVVLEAQATGVPVIATRVGGIPQIIDDGETGLLVEAKRPGQIASALEEVASDSTLQSRLGENGRRAVVDAYSWESMYDRYDRSLRETVNSYVATCDE